LDYADVMSVFTGDGTKRQLQRTKKSTKLNVICLEADG